MRHLVFSLLLAVLGGLFATQGWAAPTISSVDGSISQNQSVTISGSGLGSKAQPSPLLWDTFEVGTGKITNGKAATIGTWNSEGTTYDAEYSSTSPHSGSRSAYVPQKVGDGISHRLRKTAPSDYSTLYLDFWMNMSLVNGVYSENWKPWNINSYYGNDKLEMIFNYYNNNSGHFIFYDYSKGTLPSSSWPSDYAVNNEWKHYQLQFRESSPSASDGHVSYWVNGKSYYQSNAAMTRASSKTRNQVDIGNLWQNANGNGGGRVYVDNVYIDTSWARVELGNAATYAGSTHREIQVASSWTDKGITVTVNTGSFAANQNVYLYVVDANGNVNTTGYPVAIGGNAVGNTTPPPPTDTPPTISITSPTSTGKYSTSTGQVTIAGTASDDKGLSSVAWSTNLGGKGSATNLSGTWSSWQIGNMILSQGDNIITVTSTDTAGQKSSKTITVTYTPFQTVVIPPSPPTGLRIVN